MVDAWEEEREDEKEGDTEPQQAAQALEAPNHQHEGCEDHRHGDQPGGAVIVVEGVVWRLPCRPLCLDDDRLPGLHADVVRHGQLVVERYLLALHGAVSEPHGDLLGAELPPGHPGSGLQVLAQDSRHLGLLIADALRVERGVADRLPHIHHGDQDHEDHKDGAGDEHRQCAPDPLLERARPLLESAGPLLVLWQRLYRRLRRLRRGPGLCLGRCHLHHAVPEGPYGKWRKGGGEAAPLPSRLRVYLPYRREPPVSDGRLSVNVSTTSSTVLLAPVR